jgi:hypothetical protein
MPDNGVPGNIEERLQCLALSIERDESKETTFGTSKDNGLKRVPLEGPPTCEHLIASLA